jgi:hypothetical protein
LAGVIFADAPPAVSAATTALAATIAAIRFLILRHLPDVIFPRMPGEIPARSVA